MRFTNQPVPNVFVRAGGRYNPSRTQLMRASTRAGVVRIWGADNNPTRKQSSMGGWAGAGHI